MEYEKPRVKLIGTDGNAFALIGKVRLALKKSGASEVVISKFTAEAMSGDYDQVLRACLKYVEVE